MSLKRRLMAANARTEGARLTTPLDRGQYAEEIARRIEAEAVRCPSAACPADCWRCAASRQADRDAALARAAGRVRVIPAGTVLAEPVGAGHEPGDLYGPADGD